MPGASDTRRLRALLVAALAVAGTITAQAAPLTVTVSDDSGKPLADAVVAVLVKGAHTMAAPGASAQISQKDRQFHAQITAIQTGTPVLFPNFDTVRHHVYSFSPVQKFELKLYAGTPAAPVVFDKPGVAVLGCNIHDRMNAWVVVVDTPVFAKTDAAGHATLDVPPGEHLLSSWHARLPDPMVFIDQPLKMGSAAMPVGVTLALAPPT